ncbi:MAG: T9SS type A sorting domain-containing protein [Bacteroidales bacterium]|nr:T9SS type A sorting domain-containing protein [Bacteroidales bacterium]
MKKSILTLFVSIVLIIVCNRANAQWTYDLVNFETPVSTIIIDNTADNLWQIGTPSMVFFNAAYSGSKAIITDTLNTYAPGTSSSFIYIIRNPYTQTCYTSLEFWHKYDTDTLTDIGIIEASYDGGNSWVMVVDTNQVSPMGSYFWWDSDMNENGSTFTTHPIITSGKSDGWIKSRFNWHWWIPVVTDSIIVPPDSLMIRFTFISDNINSNKEGWMIDDIRAASAGWELCSGIEERSANREVLVFPNPFSTQTTIQTKFVMKHATLRVFNSFGQIVQQINNITGQEVIMHRNKLPAGCYFLQLVDNNRALASKRIIISD